MRSAAFLADHHIAPTSLRRSLWNRNGYGKLRLMIGARKLVKNGSRVRPLFTNSPQKRSLQPLNKR